jgi:hypothetical protein
MQEDDLLSSDTTSRLSAGRRAMAYVDMLLVDHGIFRLGYLNLHRLGDRAWRSAQPAPYQIRSLARQGLRTIVNLRG